MVFTGRETSQGTFAAPSRGFGEQSCSKSSISLPVHLGSVRACVRACWRGGRNQVAALTGTDEPITIANLIFYAEPRPKTLGQNFSVAARPHVETNLNDCEVHSCIRSN